MCLLGHQWISRGFTLRKVRCHEYTRSRKIHRTLITQEMREDLQIDFLPRNAFWTFLLDPLLPYRGTSVSKIPPPQTKSISDWVGLFVICFRSSEMTDPRRCPRDGPILESHRLQRRHAKLKPTTNYQLQKSIFFGGQRNITGQNTSLPKRLKGVSREKIDLSRVFPK